MFTHPERRSYVRTGAALCAASMCALLLLSSTAAAEVTEDDRGFSLGVTLIGSSLHVDTDANEDLFIDDGGGGLALDVGYRFNPTFLLELCVGAANHNTSDPAIDARFEEVQVLGYYRFSPGSAFRPYLKGGFGGYGLHVEEGSISTRVEGGGVALGGGFRYFFSPHFSIGLDLTHNIIRYDTATVSLEGFSYEWAIDEDGAATTLGLAFGYSF